MKVFFSGSRYFHETYEDIYKQISAILKDNGLEVIDNTIVKIPKNAVSVDESRKKEIYQSLIKSLDKSDISVFEASYPSTIHIGHEITLAIDKGKPVIVLYSDKPGHEPMLFRGISTDKVVWVAYNPENLEEKLTEAVEQAKQNSDVRFNFFVSPKILTYLDFVAQKRMIPRSVFLRDLIEKEMKKDKQYKGQ